MSGSHEKLPWLFWAQLVLVAIVGTLYFLNSGKHEGATAHGTSEASQALKPIGDVAVSGGSSDAAASGGGRAGKDIVKNTCQSCHANGIANAPKMDESAKADWEARMAKGMDEVIAVAKKGKGAMPPMGTDPSLSDAELKSAIVYMLEKAGVDAGSSAEAPVANTENSMAAGHGETEATTPAAPAAPAAPEPPATPETPSSVVAAAETVVAATSSEAVAVASEPSAEAKPAIDGAKLYKNACFACHDTGAAGAPKTGDKAAWADRIAQGEEALYNVAIKGKGAMPPKGGYMDLSDDEVKAIVDHMVSSSQ